MASQQSNWTEATQKAFEAALILAKDHANSNITPAHLASALLAPTASENGTAGGPTLFHSILTKGTPRLSLLSSPAPSLASTTANTRSVYLNCSWRFTRNPQPILGQIHRSITSPGASSR